MDLQTSQQAHQERMLRLGSELAHKNAMELEAQRAKYAVGLQGKQALLAGLQKDRDTWAKGQETPGEIRAYQGQGWLPRGATKPTQPLDLATKEMHDWFKTHEGNVEGVIQQAGLNPQAAEKVRLGFKSRDPEIYHNFQPAFTNYATANKGFFGNRMTDLSEGLKTTGEAVFPANPPSPAQNPGWYTP